MLHLRAFAFGLLLAASSAAAQTSDETIALYCARGAGEYPDAEMTLNPEGGHVVRVVYVGYRPSPARADWTLRDCLNTALKLDGSRDIVVRLWYRDRFQSSAQAAAGMAYRAASRKVTRF
jgi:hypothetical protein